MGILQSALNSKALSRHGSEFARVGTSTMQGCRIHQEDAHRICLTLPNHPEFSFFGVFDGHGGGEASKFVKKHLLHELDKLPDFEDQTLRDAMIALDKRFVADENVSIRENGTTCVCCLVQRVQSKEEEKHDEFNIICCNIGDSRSLLLRKNGFVPLSEDHKPVNDIERERIMAAGGKVLSARVDGNLAVSRAFGDWSLKCNPELSAAEQKVSCVPDIVRQSCQAGDILFLSCDGIFEHLSNEQVVDILRENFDNDNPDPANTLIHLFDAALASGSTDNMTGVLVHFADGTEYQFGEQYIPGALFQHQSDTTFLEAYLKDAENFVSDTNFLRLIAYHQDYKELPDARNHDLLLEIKRLNPLSISIEELVTLMNALQSRIAITPTDMETIRDNLGLTTAQHVADHFEQAPEDHSWRQHNISDNITSSLRALVLMWRRLDDLEEPPERPPLRPAHDQYDSDGDSGVEFMSRYTPVSVHASDSSDESSDDDERDDDGDEVQDDDDDDGDDVDVSDGDNADMNDDDDDGDAVMQVDASSPVDLDSSDKQSSAAVQRSESSESSGLLIEQDDAG